MENQKQPQKPNLTFADFTAPLKDPVPPMLKKEGLKPSQPPPPPQKPKGEEFGDPSVISQDGQKFRDQFKLQFYYPGVSDRQPHKQDQFRYCYTFFKRMGKRGHSDIGDKFDYFLFKADQNINHYKSRFMPELKEAALGATQNPYNPFGLNTEFKINILDDHHFIQMRDQMHAEQKSVPLDNEMVVFEGCDEDDKIVLGGRNAFLSHFCTFFNFNICYANQEASSIQKGIKQFNNAEKLDQSLDSFMKSFDKKME